MSGEYKVYNITEFFVAEVATAYRPVGIELISLFTQAIFE